MVRMLDALARLEAKGRAPLPLAGMRVRMQCGGWVRLQEEIGRVSTRCSWADVREIDESDELTVRLLGLVLRRLTAPYVTVVPCMSMSVAGVVHHWECEWDRGGRRVWLGRTELECLEVAIAAAAGLAGET